MNCLNIQDRQPGWLRKESSHHSETVETVESSTTKLSGNILFGRLINEKSSTSVPNNNHKSIAFSFLGKDLRKPVGGASTSISANNSPFGRSNVPSSNSGTPFSVFKSLEPISVVTGSAKRPNSTISSAPNTDGSVNLLSLEKEQKKLKKKKLSFG